MEKETKAEEEEWGFRGLGVMRSEFRTGTESGRTEENGKPRRAKRMVPYFHSPWGRLGMRCTWMAPLRLWEQGEGSLGGCQAQEASEVCAGQHAPLLPQLLMLLPVARRNLHTHTHMHT